MSETNEIEHITQTNKFAKYFVLIVLFALPLVAYLFFLQGKHHFDTLPVLTQEVSELSKFKTLEGKYLRLKDSVTIITFLGENPYKRLGYISNLNEKIYKEFHEFDTFQLISILPEKGRNDIVSIKNQMQETTNITDWHFITGNPEDITAMFKSLKTDLKLNGDLSSDYAFIIDKNKALRGRDDDPDKTMVYGYDTSSIASLNKIMVDDIRIMLAEYRFAFKKNRDQKLNEDDR
jgi:hypothetical protein